MPSPTCFTSYSWDSEGHRDWVRKLSSDLQSNGVLVSLDQWDLGPGDDILAYMETKVRESDFVILVCTPSYARKVNERRGGAGYETSIVTGEIFSDFSEQTSSKFIPLLRSGNPETSLPSYLRSRLYVDFTKDVMYKTSIQSLLRKLHSAPRHLRPQLGARPKFSTSEEKVSSESKVTYCVTCGALAGAKSLCTTLLGRHSFTSREGTVYCETCGSIPQILPSTCSTLLGSHRFLSTNKDANDIYCSICGGRVGKKSICSTLIGRHAFR